MLCPQFEQNLAPVGFSEPHSVQKLFCATGVPQPGQNFAPGGIGVPHLEQVLPATVTACCGAGSLNICSAILSPAAIPTASAIPEPDPFCIASAALIC